VKIGGEEREVTLDELQKGYMMGADYTQKTMALSEQRKQIEAKAAEVDTQLKNAQELVENELDWFDSPEAKELREYDPDEYLKKFEKAKTKAHKFEQLRAKKLEEQQAKMSEQIKQEQEHLKTKIPDWLDESTVRKEFPQVVQTMKSIGFSDQELDGITDHRLMVLARKAMLYDAIASQDISSKQVKTPPKVATPGTPKSAEQRVSREAQEIRNRLRQKGDMGSAVAAIQNLMRK
jgi:hypothetical protein